MKRLASTDSRSWAVAPRAGGWWGHVGAVAVCCVAVVAALPLSSVLDTASLMLVFLLAVVVVAALFGRGPALLASVLCVVLFNVAFVPPRFSLLVADERFLFTFAVMLAVGLVVGQLTAGLRAQAREALAREAQMHSLYGIARDLGGALTPQEIARTADAFARQHFSCSAIFWVVDRDGAPQLVHGEPEPGLTKQAQALVEATRGGRPPVACGVSVSGAFLLPLPGTMAVRGVAALDRVVPAGYSDDERRLLDTWATLAGGALERLHYIDVVRESAVEVEGERLRSTLLAAISHDLRTPLASLAGLSETLLIARPPLHGEPAAIARSIAATARRMGALVTNLLDMARLESGAVRLDRQWQPVEEFIGSALASVEPVLPAARVQVHLDEGLPLVQIDAVLMERVLVNLLENAARHTPVTSRVEVRATVEEGALVLVVEDDGPGLPQGRHDALFRLFERGAKEGSIPGAGVGLALCRAVVQAHDGFITAHDAPGTGARFVVRLPLGDPPELPGPEALLLEREG